MPRVSASTRYAIETSLNDPWPVYVSESLQNSPDIRYQGICFISKVVTTTCYLSSTNIPFWLFPAITGLHKASLTTVAVRFEVLKGS